MFHLCLGLELPPHGDWQEPDWGDASTEQLKEISGHKETIVSVLQPRTHPDTSAEDYWTNPVTPGLGRES